MEIIVEPATEEMSVLTQILVSMCATLGTAAFTAMIAWLFKTYQQFRTMNESLLQIRADNAEIKEDFKRLDRKVDKHDEILHNIVFQIKNNQ